MATEKKQPVIDFELAKELVGGQEALAQEMFKMLFDSLPEHQKEITEAAKNKDLALTGKAAHKLHGATCYCGTPRLKEAVKALEIAAKAEENEQIDPLLETLNTEIDLFIKAYQNRQ